MEYFVYRRRCSHCRQACVCVCVAIARPGLTWLGLAQLDLDYFFPLLHFRSFIHFLLHI